MKIAFAGTPKFASNILEYLISKYSIDFVLTQLDKPAGRGMKLQSSAVKQVALSYSIPVYQPISLNPQKDKLAITVHEKLKTIDVLIVVAYGLILPASIVNNFYCINIHPSLLPRWRGAAPIQRTIQAGDKQSGVCIMHMDSGLDTGDIMYMQTLDILANETYPSLSTRLNHLSNQCLDIVLQDLEYYKSIAQKQSVNGITYAQKIDKEELIIDLNNSAFKIAKDIQAFTPIACKIGGYKIYNALAIDLISNKVNGEVLKIDDGILISCEQGKSALNVLNIQAPNKKPMYYQDFIQNFNIKVGDKLFS